MPFRRRFTRRRRTRRRRRATRFRGRRMFRRRRVVLDPERKDLTFLSPLDVDIPITGLIQLMNACQTGIETDERIGRQMVSTSVWLDGNIQFGAGALGCQFVKVWLLRISQPNGVVLALGDFLNNTTRPTFSARNLSNRGAIKVLWSRSYRLDAFHPCAKIRVMKKMRTVTRYNGPLGGIVTIDSNALYLVFISETVAGPTTPTINYTTRVRFVG